jgi:hypothetical protein
MRFPSRDIRPAHVPAREIWADQLARPLRLRLLRAGGVQLRPTINGEPFSYRPSARIRALPVTEPTASWAFPPYCGGCLPNDFRP